MASPSDSRPDPDALLAQLQEAQATQQRGKLRIYFGANAGVGKTYAYLVPALLAGGKVIVSTGTSGFQVRRGCWPAAMATIIVSPIARLTASMTPATMPGSLAGSWRPTSRLSGISSARWSKGFCARGHRMGTASRFRTNLRTIGC